MSRLNDTELLALCDCEHCPLASVRNPVMGHGNANARIVIVGEAPGEQEARQHVPFIGPSGQLLDKTLSKVGSDRAQVYVTNTTLCRPKAKGSGNIPPPIEAIRACSARLAAEIQSINPIITIATGGPAAKTLLNTQKSITEIQGVLQWNEELETWIIPTFHPAYILRGQTAAYEDFLGDIYRAAQLADGDIPFPDKEIVFEYTYYGKDGDDTEFAEDALRTMIEGDLGYTFALDVETGHPDSINTPLLTIQFGTVDRAYVFDAQIFFENNDLYNLLYDFLSSTKHTFLIHNMSFDLQYIKKYFGAHWSEMPNLIDTMCLALGTTERGTAVGLKYLARKWFNAPYYEAELAPYLRAQKSDKTALKRKRDYRDIPRNILAKYAAADVIYTARLFPILEKEVIAENTRSLCYDILMPAQKLFADLQETGVAVDRHMVETLRQQWYPVLDELRNNITQWAIAHGWDQEVFNPNSSKQKCLFFYEILNLKQPPISRLKAKNAKLKGTKPSPETGQPFRDMYRLSNHYSGISDLVRLLDIFAYLSRVIQTYVDGINDDIREDGRVHPQFSLFTTTGRQVVKNPPLQTIPRPVSSEGTVVHAGAIANFRDMFIAQPRPFIDNEDDEYTFVSYDYSQLELRIGWMLSHDEAMGAACLTGDFHKAAAARLLHKAIELVTKSERSFFKHITFGLMYGMKAYTLAHHYLKCSEQEAQAYIDEWFELFNQFHLYYMEQQENVRKTGRAQTIFGRVRRWPLITRETLSEILNQAINFPIQSTANEFGLLAMVRLDPMLKEMGIGRGLFTVHDQLNFEIKRQYVPEARDIIRREMLWIPPQARAIAPSNFALDVEMEAGRSWGEAFDIDDYLAGKTHERKLQIAGEMELSFMRQLAEETATEL